jgi:hypothetical protein
MKTFLDNFFGFVQQFLPSKKYSTSKLDVISRSVLNQRTDILFEYVTSKAVDFDIAKPKAIRTVVLPENESTWARDLLQKEQLTVADVIDGFSQITPGIIEILAFRIERVKCDDENFYSSVFTSWLPKQIHLIFHIDPALFDEESASKLL